MANLSVIAAQSPAGQWITAYCGNLHGVAPIISRFRQLQYGALRRRLKQEPSTPSGMSSNLPKEAATNYNSFNVDHPTLRKLPMAHKNKVIRSINLDGETICVDVFLRPDGTYGFDEFRRDPEDGRGWYSIGHHGAASFDTFDHAMAQAKAKVSWLSEIISD